MTRYTRKFLSVLGMSAILAAGAAHAEDKTVSIVDDRGVTVEVPAQPKRIASISYFADDVALALGIKPVASTYMTAGREPGFLLGLTAGMKQIGQRAKPNLELLSEAKPDLIIAIRRYTVGNAAQLQNIAPYVAYNMELLEESYSETAALSKLLGKPERGEQLNADFRKHLAEFAAKAPKDKHPRFLIMWGGATPFAFHTENTSASIVAAIGGDNIPGPKTPGGEFGIDLSLETMLEKDPEVIFVYDSGPDRPHEGNPIWSQLSAVKNNRVFYVGDQWVETNGPIAREIVLREAAHYLYPDTFPAVDVKAEAAKLIPAELQN
ncbi:iron-siderophore ABC transporter substrate-binding protein [Rhizobium phaseoli]|uniref:ABC transporter substrate-binding protein n=1 Tax=Rhizobium phaseoli TaxID=396 RepID=A0A192TE66_9HYPH|nr:MULTISPECIES: ABC transporter substrate-binding protein [Rhizobium]MDH6647031.1 iron complex transport system substrate-binding protein [Rhizobium esperanzae]ANL41172.1 iron-siderophore ABC transporter substrate-binding protein [Rhizobium phaseoli]ANL53907.1 iron-siderophore ABC transporter substrate-binding protein [Rhizobium phaseoli]ANL60160.1 iron-siderophore ABC transporter substrate-binding protein [Rhizobium phaseoli]ANL72759.1 iron-siderophore ABC transporter substrate-binding prote